MQVQHLDLVFLAAFVMLFLFRSIYRAPALIMSVSYTLYISVTNTITDAPTFYLALTIQELITGYMLSLSYKITNIKNVLYMSYLSFFGVFNHLYGRIAYGYDLDTGLYVILCLSVVSMQIILMIQRPMHDGIHRSPNRVGRIFFNIGTGNKSNTKVPTKIGKEAK